MISGYGINLSSKNLGRLKADRDVNGAVVVFAAPSAGQLRRLVQRAHTLASSGTIPPPRPAFLFWNMETWYQRGMDDGTTMRRLRDPRTVLSEDYVLNLKSERRPLVVTDVSFDAPAAAEQER